jgi:hypothetical protein
MALKNWRKEKALSFILISDPTENRWIPSLTYPGTYLYKLTDLVEEPQELFNGDVPLVRGDITSDLSVGEWDWVVNEDRFTKLTVNDGLPNRWNNYALETNTYYYSNNNTNFTRIQTKPIEVRRHGVILTEGASGAQLNPGEWKWQLDPTGVYATIYIHNDYDPDQGFNPGATEVFPTDGTGVTVDGAGTQYHFDPTDPKEIDGFITYNDGTVPNTIYVKMEQEPVNYTINKPGEVVNIVDTIPSGSVAIIFGIILFNSDVGSNTKVTLNIVDNNDNVVSFFRAEILPLQSVFFDNKIVLEAGQRIEIRSNNENISSVVSGDIS